jgi:hypothetical protein
MTRWLYAAYPSSSRLWRSSKYVGFPLAHLLLCGFVADEFVSQDFEAYVTKTEPWGMRSGITKIIPPPEWVGSLPAMDRRTLSNVQIRNPIQQNMMGNGGVFRQTNIEKNKSRPLSVREWFEKCGQDKFAGPMPREIERGSKEAREMRAEMEREKKAAKEKKLAERERRRMQRLKDEEARAAAEAQAQTRDGNRTRWRRNAGRSRGRRRCFIGYRPRAGSLVLWIIPLVSRPYRHDPRARATGSMVCRHGPVVSLAAQEYPTGGLHTRGMCAAAGQVLEEYGSGRAELVRSGSHAG